MTKHSDEEMEFWGNFFERHGIGAKAGITFDQFLANPLYYVFELKLDAYLEVDPNLDAAAQRIEGDTHEPLLPSQERVAREIRDEDIDQALGRVAHGEQTAEDVELLEDTIAAARGIRDIPRRDGRAIEALHHTRHPDSRSDFRTRKGG